MSLVFAGICPHSPMLWPRGKKMKETEKTKEAIEKLQEDLYVTNPDIIIFLSPQAGKYTDSFTFNIATVFKADLSDVGDLSVRDRFKCEKVLPTLIKENERSENFPITIVSQEKMDYTSSFLAVYLAKALKNFSIMPIGFCDLDYKRHVDFGFMIKDFIYQTNKRVAVICGGDLSHSLKTDSPAGYSPSGEEFDRKTREFLSTRNTAGLLRLNPDMVNKACEYDFRSILILAGILKNVKYNFKLYAYETPLGVGQLTANFEL